MPISERGFSQGFSLIELIVVMVVLGVLAGLSAMFVTRPVEAYLAAVRRAELVDIADTALQRIARDVRAALPNSVRVSQSGSVYYLEFLPVRQGGRYRSEQDSTADCAATPGAAGCNSLDFTAAGETSFEVLGPPTSTAEGDFLVIYNLGVDADSDAWQGGNRRTVSAPAGTVSSVTFSAGAGRLPYESPARRFFITGGPVTYVCDPAAHTIRRYWNYTLSGNQPITLAALTAGGTAAGALLANRVQACAFRYDGGVSQRLGQLTLRIVLENAEGSNAEAISLYREVAVNNEP